MTTVDQEVILVEDNVSPIPKNSPSNFLIPANKWYTKSIKTIENPTLISRLEFISSSKDK